MRTLDGQSISNTEPPSSAYPYGRAKNSSPPSARNGTPIQEEDLLTDIPYAMLAVMKAAGIVPNEVPEDIDTSQFKDALTSLIGGFWTQDIIEKTLTPAQPGITINQVASQWDETFLEDKPRYTLSSHFIIFENDSFGNTIEMYLNAAINDLSQLISTNGETAVTITFSDNGDFRIRFYAPSAGVGSILTLTKYWEFLDVGHLLTTGSIILSSSDTTKENGEVWYDTLFGVLMNKEGGTTYEINDHNDKFNLQGGVADERYHLTETQHIAAILLKYMEESIGMFPENVYFNENWLGIGDFVQNNWNPADIGFEIGFRHGMVDMVSVLALTSQLYINAADEYRKSQGAGSYFGMTAEFDTNAGSYTVKRSDAKSGTPDALLTMLDLLILDRDILQILGSMIVGDRASGTRVNGEIWYDTGLTKLRGKENGVESDLINGSGIDRFAFDVENSTSQNISSTGSDIKVNFATENLDEGSNWNTGTSTYTNGATPADIAVFARIEFDAPFGGKITLKIKHNGVTKVGQSVELAFEEDNIFLNCSMEVKLAASDTLEVYANNNTGTSITILNTEATRFSGKKINE